MQTYQRSIFARNDTMLGVCQAIGEDLGFNPTWLRVAFAVGLFFSLGITASVYLALGAIVLATRLIHRAPRKPMPQVAAAPAAVEAVPAVAPASARNDEELIPMAVAA